MTLPKKFALPEIAREGLTPPELELLAWVEKLIAMANGLQEEVGGAADKAVDLEGCESPYRQLPGFGR